MSTDQAPGTGQPRRSRWHKSSYSGTAGNCVEVAQLGAQTHAVRDSKNPTGPVLTCTTQQWTTFTTHLPTGEPY
jgi:Domain of unknown function (DUF397)